VKPLPFPVKRENGIVWVDAQVDAAFRQALMDGVPPNLRAKMREALAATPDKGAMRHSIRYFGDELEDIKRRIAPLIIQLNKTLSESFRLPGLFDWLNATNFGNDYRMIKVFKDWSDMVLSDRRQRFLNGA
jgi:hypothetical protein